MATNAIARAIAAGHSLASVAEVVDIHGHGGPWYDFYVPSSDCESMLRMMDRLGVSAVVLAPHLSVGPAVTEGNDLAIEWSRRYPRRIFGYAVPYPHQPLELIKAELNRALDSGLVAIKIHPSTHNQPVFSDPYRVTWEVARERGTFILSHSWHGDSRCSPAALAEMAQQFPEVPVILGHSGGVPAGFEEAIALAKKQPNLYLDTCGSYVTGAWVRRFVAEVGAERVLYGSDMPFIDPRYSLGKVGLSGLTEEELRQVLGLSAKKLLTSAGACLA
jgi:predicted TIM-barrel fold metal-dependent hydrolase